MRSNGLLNPHTLHCLIKGRGFVQCDGWKGKEVAESWDNEDTRLSVCVSCESSGTLHTNQFTDAVRAYLHCRWYMSSRSTLIRSGGKKKITKTRRADGHKADRSRTWRVSILQFPTTAREYILQCPMIKTKTWNHFLFFSVSLSMTRIESVLHAQLYLVSLCQCFFQFLVRESRLNPLLEEPGNLFRCPADKRPWVQQLV